MYGDGEVRVESRHHTLRAVTAEAARRTRDFQAGMAEHGGTSGYYYAATWGRGEDTFWADMPPTDVHDEADAGAAP